MNDLMMFVLGFAAGFIMADIGIWYWLKECKTKYRPSTGKLEDE